MPAWDDEQYLRFANQRTRPAGELLSRVPSTEPGYVIDLGCGPGNSTALLRSRWPRARVVGVDSSAEMLERARADWSDGEWIQADAATFRAATPADVLFSNALLQWLPNHAELFVNLCHQVRPGGILAVQVPRNFDEPSHRLMHQIDGPWNSRFAELRRPSPVHAPAFYYDTLAPHCDTIDVWQTTYEQVMPDASSIVEWVKGTGIRPYLAKLTPTEQSEYLTAYTQAIDGAYPPRVDGMRLFSFHRLFIVAHRRREREG